MFFVCLFVCLFFNSGFQLMRPTYAVESIPLYPNFTDLNINIFQKYLQSWHKINHHNCSNWGEKICLIIIFDSPWGSSKLMVKKRGYSRLLDYSNSSEAINQCNLKYYNYLIFHHHAKQAIKVNTTLVVWYFLIAQWHPVL